MNISAEAVAAEVRAWLHDNWSPDRPRDEWREALARSGWAAPTWPEEWFGRGLPPRLRGTVAQEFRAIGARGDGQDVSQLPGNVILSHGNDEQKKRFLLPLLLGEHRGCLLYSEPGAGSDLAALQTRAERADDSWRITGQKVWTSGAREATHGLLVARSDWDVPKHQGITFFWFPMQQDAVEVRPIRQVTRGAEFNEVFLDAAVAPDDHRLGEVNDGWRVLQTALGFERLIMGSQTQERKRRQEPTREQILAARRSPWTRKVGGADYVELAEQRGRSDDPVVRQQIARLHSLEQVNRWNGLRARVEARAGNSSLMSLGKLAMSRIVHTGVEVTTELLGAESLLDGDSSGLAAEVNRSAFAAYVTSIGGGTDQIQRNIIAERVLGLPREPEVDRDVPFREVRKAQAVRSFGEQIGKAESR